MDRSYLSDSSSEGVAIPTESEEDDLDANDFVNKGLSNKFLPYKLASTIKKVTNYDGPEYERHRIFYGYYLAIKMALKEPRNLYIMTEIKEKNDPTYGSTVKKINAPTSPKTLAQAFKAVRYYN